jgi:aspartate/methionine/tyrosine aminotransferase
VVVEEPAYEPLRRIPAALGAEVLRLPRLPERGWGLDREALGRLVARRPSLLLLSHPHNPSLALLSAADQAALADFAAASDCAVLSDEVYLEFLAGDDVHSLRHRLPDAAILRSFTKTMGLGPIRCSVLLGPVDWVAGAAARSDYGPVRVPAPSLAVAEAAWRRREALWARARSVAAAAHPLVERWAAGLGDLLEVEIPGAGIICLPRLRSGPAAAAAAWARDQGVTGPFGHGLDGEADASIWWIEALRRRHGVLVTPGTFFERPTAFRLGFGLAPAALTEGLDALSRLLREACSRGR